MRRALTLAALALVVGGAWTSAGAEAFPQRGQGIGDMPRPQTFRIQVGDVDGFHPGDPFDVPPMSAACCDIVQFCESQPGMCGHADLDEYGDDRPVGLSMSFSIPQGTRIAAATLRFAFLATAPAACNDFILTSPAQYPAIALQDIVGCEPQHEQAYVARVDLLNVPIRTCNAPGPDGSWCGAPDQYVSLAPRLAQDRRLDLVFGDDVMIDYAVLRITLEPIAPPYDGGKVPVDVSPNPAGGDVGFSFTLLHRGMTTVEVFDVLGRLVATPAKEEMGPGALRIRWDGRAGDGTRTPPGTYFVRLRTEEGTGSAKLLRLAR